MNGGQHAVTAVFRAGHSSSSSITNSAGRFSPRCSAAVFYNSYAPQSLSLHSCGARSLLLLAACTPCCCCCPPACYCSRNEAGIDTWGIGHIAAVGIDVLDIPRRWYSSRKHSRGGDLICHAAVARRRCALAVWTGAGCVGLGGRAGGRLCGVL